MLERQQSRDQADLGVTDNRMQTDAEYKTVARCNEGDWNINNVAGRNQFLSVCPCYSLFQMLMQPSPKYLTPLFHIHFIILFVQLIRSSLVTSYVRRYFNPIVRCIISVTYDCILISSILIVFVLMMFSHVTLMKGYITTGLRLLACLRKYHFF